MKILYTTIKLLVLTLAILASSCVEQSDIESTNNSKYKSQLRFNVAQSTTRGSATENDVKRLDILLFNNNQLEKIVRNITSFSTSEDGYSYVELGFDTEGVRRAYVIANVDDETWMNTLAPGLTTVAQLIDLQTGKLTQMANPPLVMYGISEDINFSTAQSSVLCPLYRVVARIDVENKASNFKLLSARLINSKVASTIFPNATPADSDMKDFEPEKLLEGTNNIRLYSYENATTNIAKATKIEITGSVNDLPLTYTVELEQKNELIPIQRNYRYTVNINNVEDNQLNTTLTVLPWKMGNDITEVVGGNQPTVEVVIPAEVGTYSVADSLFTITAKGGQITFDAKANAECGIELQGDWLSSVDNSPTRAPSYIDGRFVVNLSENKTNVERKATIRIYNKISNKSRSFNLTQAVAEAAEEKYMVVVVAGQSNAVGYDQSAIDLIDQQTSDRALQLSYRRGVTTPNLDLIKLTWSADDIDAKKDERMNESGGKGLKGIHLPLAKELLKQIPADYKVVVIPVAFTTSRFAARDSYGTYNTAMMRPDNMVSVLRWGAQSAYTRTIIDRTRKVLDMNPKNKLLGIVWCQGENDNTDANYQYDQFTSTANLILTDLNKTHGDRTYYGAIDKRSWYNFSSCTYWVDWYSVGDASAVFGGYKVWNPDNYIYVPMTLPSNRPGGGGYGVYHFGENAYRTIAQMVVQRMNENGALYNGEPSRANTHFKDKTTLSEANSLGGSIDDVDVSSSLLTMIPFDASATEAKAGNILISSVRLSLSSATGLIDLNNKPRNRNALNLSRNGGYMKLRAVPATTNWSVSFMFKRTGSMDADMQTIIPPTDMNNPFIGFKKYNSNMGVAKAAEFVAEPIATTVKLNGVPGLFMAANKVRTLTEWVHYVVSYNSSTKETCVYMNGDLVQNEKVSTSALSILPSTIYIGNAINSAPGAEGQLADLYIWGKVVTPSTVKKVFLMSYYGFTK